MGNKLLRLGGGGGGAKYRFVFTHHKNTDRWGGRAIKFDVPAGLEPLLDLYLSEVRPRLARAGVPNLIVGPAGRALTTDSWSGRFKDILRDWGAPFSFPPRRLRHIYVDDAMRGDKAVPRPANEEAAMVSGAACASLPRPASVFSPQHWVGARPGAGRCVLTHQLCKGGRGGLAGRFELPAGWPSRAQGAACRAAHQSATSRARPPAPRLALQVMGNSTAVWKVYDLAAHTLGVQKAVDESQGWREGHLRVAAAARKRKAAALESSSSGEEEAGE